MPFLPEPVEIIGTAGRHQLVRARSTGKVPARNILPIHKVNKNLSKMTQLSPRIDTNQYRDRLGSGGEAIAKMIEIMPAAQAQYPTAPI